MNAQIDVHVMGESQEFIIREGKALEPKEPRAISIIGVLASPLVWLTQRLGQIDQKTAHVLVSRADMKITLKVDETSHYAGTIQGSLELHPMFKKFGINTDKALSNFDMAKLFKMNRSVFESTSVAMNLVSLLQNFQAKVAKEIEKADDNRGNKRDLKAQIVESNLPDTFNLIVPIFKGTDKQTIPVEVYVNADDFNCTLISPVANDLIEEMRDSEIDKVLESISQIAPGIAIIEQ